MNNLKVTIRIKKLEDKGALKAFADITIADVFMVHGLKVIQGKDALFVAMPSRKNGEKFVDIAHPISKEFDEYLKELVIEEYNK